MCVRVKLVFVFFTGLFSIFVSFSVSLDNFGFMLLLLSDLVFFGTDPRDWLGRTSPK